VDKKLKDFIDLQLFAINDICDGDKTTYLVNVHSIAKRLFLEKYFFSECKSRDIDTAGVLATLRKDKISKLLK
jgi:hypothetical protein